MQIYAIEMKTKKLTELIENGSQGQQKVAKWRGVMRIRRGRRGGRMDHVTNQKGKGRRKGEEIVVTSQKWWEGHVLRTDNEVTTHRWTGVGLRAQAK